MLVFKVVTSEDEARDTSKKNKEWLLHWKWNLTDAWFVFIMWHQCAWSVLNTKCKVVVSIFFYWLTWNPIFWTLDASHCLLRVFSLILVSLQCRFCAAVKLDNITQQFKKRCRREGVLPPCPVSTSPAPLILWSLKTSNMNIWRFLYSLLTAAGIICNLRLAV